MHRGTNTKKKIRHICIFHSICILCTYNHDNKAKCIIQYIIISTQHCYNYNFHEPLTKIQKPVGSITQHLFTFIHVMVIF